MQTSAQGVADLELHEGTVLKAYRCPAGVWTIGAGLTAGSGVVKPRAGMVISPVEATNLLQSALRRNYEPRVSKAMPGAKQHEFDAGISFDFNTGAIHKASWVKAWLTGNWAQVKVRLFQWRKGGGKVLPGLVRRREAEFLLMQGGVYASKNQLLPKSLDQRSAKVTLPLDLREIVAVKEGLRKLGFDPGDTVGEVARSAVIAFQTKHDLKVDGILGRATLSTLQRALDARAQTVPVIATASLAGVSEASGVDDVVSIVPWAADAVLVASVLCGLWLAWRYRDAVAAAIQSPLPRVAALLRSF